MSEELILAIYHNKLSEVERLLDSGSIDLEYRYKMSNGQDVVTPLQCAAGNANIGAIKLLLARGADPLSLSQSGRSALGMAASFGHLEACELLLPVSDVQTVMAAYKYVLHTIKMTNLVTNLENKRQRCKLVRDYLFVAACNIGNQGLVREMLQQPGADINSYYRGVTGLHAACEAGYKSTVFELLCHKELNVNLPSNRMGDNVTSVATALHYACQYHECLKQNKPVEDEELNSRIDIVEALLDHGAEIDMRDSDGLAPIHLAIMFNNLEMVKLLDLRGANFNLMFDYPEDIIKKHMPNVDSFPGDIFTLAIGKPLEMYNYLKNRIQSKNSFNKREYIGGHYRFNYLHPNACIKPIRFDDWLESHAKNLTLNS